jgi:peptidoglycan/xylan/chitin deacetylase (PgdA/CDA1 family)
MLSYLTLYSELKEPYAKYGIEHFLKKYGFTCIDNQADADIFVGYLVPEIRIKGVQIILSKGALDKTCYLTINGENIPLFKKPIEQTDGNLMWKVKSGTKEYDCLSILNNRIKVGFDIFGEIGRILAGCYDEYFLRKDEMGTKLRLMPTVDILEEALVSAINHVIPGSIHRFTWPDNRNFALVLTHDVDRVYKTYQYLPSIWNYAKKFNISKLGYHLINLFFKHGVNNPYWVFEDICTLENSLGVKSTYYFLNEKGKHNPLSLQSWILYRGVYDVESTAVKRVIRKLAETGFEIGVHGSYNSFNNLGLLQSEKSTLESIIGSETNGIRQHYLNYDLNRTPEMHYKSGFKYDTSVGYRPITGIGFRRGTSFPFQVMLPDLNVSTLLEIPLLIMDAAVYTTATATVDECLNILEQVEKYSGALTILWHSQAFNRQEYPGCAEIYEELINEAKTRNAWVATANEVYEWMTRKNCGSSVSKGE